MLLFQFLHTIVLFITISLATPTTVGATIGREINCQNITILGFADNTCSSPLVQAQLYSSGDNSPIALYWDLLCIEGSCIETWPIVVHSIKYGQVSFQSPKCYATMYSYFTDGIVDGRPILATFDITTPGQLDDTCYTFDNTTSRYTAIEMLDTIPGENVTIPGYPNL